MRKLYFPAEFRLRMIGIYNGYDDKPHLLFRDLVGDVHNFILDETLIEKIRGLVGVLNADIYE